MVAVKIPKKTDARGFGADGFTVGAWGADLTVGADLTFQGIRFFYRYFGCWGALGSHFGVDGFTFGAWGADLTFQGIRFLGILGAVKIPGKKRMPGGALGSHFGKG